MIAFKNAANGDRITLYVKCKVCMHDINIGSRFKAHSHVYTIATQAGLKKKAQ